MIAAGEPQVYVPHGKLVLAEYESASRRTSTFNTSLDSQEIYHLFGTDNSVFTEEEIYINDTNVVWSRGNGDVYWELIKKFTTKEPIQQALWFDFDENPDRPACANMQADKETEKTRKKIPSLCIVEKSKIIVLTRDGDEFISAVPYEIHKVWRTKFGLVIEKTQNSSPEIPNWFSLYHPLEEIVPIVLRDGTDRDHVNFARDKKLKFVFTCDNPSICVTFNEDTGLHSIWLIRKAEVDETLFLGTKSTPTSQNSYSGTFVPSSLSLSKSFALSQIQNTSLQSPSLSHLFSSSSKQTPKFDAESSRFTTPKASKSFIQHFGLSSLQLTQSKLSGTPPLKRVGSSRISAILARTPVPSPSASSCLNDLDVPEDEEPLLPDLCLQILWTEDQKKPSQTAASKAFVASDWLGKTYICWLLDDEKLLRCVEIKVTEIKTASHLLYICCSPWTVAAKDAEYVPGIKAILILDAASDNSLTLYSGSTKLAKVHVPTCAPLTGISMSMQRLSLEAGEHSRRSNSLKFVPSTPLNSSRRSSLLHGEIVGAMLADNVTLSPIPANTVVFKSLQDPVGRSITIKSSDHSSIRTSLPPLASSHLVQRSFSALRAALPPDVYLSVAARFYCVRNAPGPADFSPEAEWSAFRSTLLALLGFDAKNLDVSNQPASPVMEAAKKSRTNIEEGSECDWEYLISSHYSRAVGPQLSAMFGFDVPVRNGHQIEVEVGSDSALFAYIPHVLLVLHLLYEDLKLDTLLWADSQQLATLLIPLASCLNLPKYCDHYWRDFPAVWKRVKVGVCGPSSDLDKIQPLAQRMETPWNVYQFLLALMEPGRGHVTPYPHLRQVNSRSRDVIQLYGLLCERSDGQSTELVRDYDWAEHVMAGKPQGPISSRHSSGGQGKHAAVVQKLAELQWTLAAVNSLPAGVSLPIRNALYVCQLDPATDWPDEAYRLINRPDLAKSATDKSLNPNLNLKSENRSERKSGLAKEETEDGMEDVVNLPVWKLLFPKDHRVQEVRRLLCSSRPVTVNLPAAQQQGLSEHELIEEREKQLLVLCIRIMALPVGRGMFTAWTTTPTVTETLGVPKLCLTGKTPQNGATVDMTHIDVPANMSLWPQFHNGVAAGLRISPETQYVDSNWINLNRNRCNGTELNAEVAGYLLGLGLTGHLNKFNDLVIHEHLNRDHEMTQLALVLGLGIGKRGSMEVDTLRIVSVYVESLSPSSTTSIEVPQNVRVAALMSVGFLYQGSAHRYMTEVLLAEIDRPPGPEMENCVDRESYSLAAGLALGLVTLGQGGQMAGLADLRLADTLYHFMVGGAKRSLPSWSKERHKNCGSSASYQIREGSTVNVDVTAPGSILALGLMFHRTNNQAVAQWMAAPDSQQLLDSIRPDFLLLRTLARGLILWDDVMPTRDWVESNVPPNIRRHSLRNPGVVEPDEHVDYETMNQAFYNIMAGACMALGLKFAGSANAEAFNTLHRYAKVLISLAGRSVAEWAGKATLESCLNVLLLSLSLVMAGTGDLQVLRLCRHLRMRTGSFSNVVTYGSHVATHMALGFLFLGGGRLSLSTSPESIAALICACYPKFPTHSNDNRYHLQALRHLHVLAAQPRLLVPRELPFGHPCYANIEVTFTDETRFRMRAPCLLPELRFLNRVQLSDDRYRTVVFDRDHNWSKITSILEGHDVLMVQRKAGCLSYVDDPTGLASLATPTLSTWSTKASTLSSFSTDKFVLFLCREFLGAGDGSPGSVFDSQSIPLESQLRKLNLVLHDCVVHEKADLVKAWLQLIQQNDAAPSTLPLWQLKFLVQFSGQESSQFVNGEMVTALRHEMEAAFDHLVPESRQAIRSYLTNRDTPANRCHPQKMATMAVFYNLPLPAADLQFSDGQDNPIALLVQLQKNGVQPKTAAKLASLLYL